MLKIKELLKEFIETQKNINTSIKELRDDLKLQMSTWATTTLKIDKLENCFETNVYTKEQTVEAINKEYDYRQMYETCEKENYALLRLIEKYCKYEDKYKVIDLFTTINAEYEIKRRK